MTAPALETTDTVGWLESVLKRELGDRISSAPAQRALYTSDASNYRKVPRLVAHPTSADELAAIVARAAEARVPITMRGAGTSIAGNAIGSGVVEGWAKTLGLRLKARGARWRLNNVQAMAALGCVANSDQWEAYWAVAA